MKKSFLIYFLLSCLCLLGCRNQSHTSKKKFNAEYLYLLESDPLPAPFPPLPQGREPYPWESKYIGKYPRITKDYFRCRGNLLHPMITRKKEGREPEHFRDCGGGEKHGLPIKEGKEFIYPKLLELLNYLQEKNHLSGNHHIRASLPPA